jgi:hypothetical protein
MDIFTIIIIAGILAAILGAKKPWAGGITGLIAFLLLFYYNISAEITLLIIIIPMGFFYALAAGFASSIIVSGLKGKGHKAGTAYMGGFGVHHPGGFILSNGERKKLKENNINREIVISY